MSAKFKLVLLSSSVLLLSACDTARNALGLERNSPDEHTVLEREPLTLPPNFNEMPEPKPGMARPQEQSPQEKVHNVILGSKSKKNKTEKSGAEKELLKNAGPADENIRNTIDSEARKDKKEKSFIKEFVGVDDEKEGKVIDPDEEYEKINGKPHPNKEKK